jgi:metal-responsive CopG/Arc/MetJ family transcriptional regulator
LIVKVNVSLPQEILQELDRAARENHTSRSAFLAQATRHYLQEKEEEKRKKRRINAAETIRSIAEKLGEWDAVGELLKSRDSH